MASQQQTVQWNEIEQILDAQPGFQVPFAQYIVNVGPVEGSVINIAPAGQAAADRIRPRPRPPQVLPRQVLDFLDRSQEQRVVGEALARGQVVDVHGPDGSGKTSLLSQAMHLQIPEDYPGGLVYLTVRHDTRDDLLQELVEYFYDTHDGRIKVTENDVRRLMAGTRALVVLDEANHLEEGDAEAIAAAVPQAAFLIAGRVPQVWQGAAVPLGGLPRTDALALFERYWGRPLGDEQDLASAICGALGDVPLLVVKTARTASQRGVSLAQVWAEVRPPVTNTPVAQALSMLGQHLSDGERQVLSAVAAPGGPSVDRPALLAISGVAPDRLDKYLQRLEKLDLLRVEGGRYALDDGLRPAIRQYAASAGLEARAAAYYRQHAGDLKAGSRHPDEENVVAALAYYQQRGDWEAVRDMVWAMEPYLVSSGRWGQWRKRLENAWQAGRELGDPATEAWAQNQLGIVALAAGDPSGAVRLFRAAGRMWRALGNRRGAAIARWNESVVLGPPPPPRETEPEPEPAPVGGATAIPMLMAGIAATLLLILGALAALTVSAGRIEPATAIATTAILPPATTVAPPPTTAAPPPTTAAPPPTTAPPPPATTVAPPPPQIDVWLAGGCDRPYAPGEVLEVRARSNAAGALDLFLRRPDGGRSLLFREEVQAGQVVGGVWDLPQPPGRWSLEGELDAGRATARCDFRVDEPAPPVIDSVYIAPMDDGQVCPADAVWIYAAISSEAGLRVARITTQPPDGEPATVEMERIDDRTYRYLATAYAKPGLAFGVEAEDVDGRLTRSEEYRYTVEPCFDVLYDFVADADQAEWEGLDPGFDESSGSSYSLSFPGESGQDAGYALWLDGADLEDGSTVADQVLETHPTWALEGSITGYYDLDSDPIITLEEGDRFVARVGLPVEAEQGSVTFELWFRPSGDEFSDLLGSLADSYDGQVLDWMIPLDALAGQAGSFRLRVLAGDSYVDDRALWIEARLERPR